VLVEAKVLSGWGCRLSEGVSGGQGVVGVGV
jgi:hypothetical protein